MKSKAGYFVLLAEIIVIIALHSARAPKPADADRSATNQQKEIQRPHVAFNNVKI
jgi:hypothetical protein